MKLCGANMVKIMVGMVGHYAVSKLKKHFEKSQKVYSPMKYCFKFEVQREPIRNRRCKQDKKFSILRGTIK